jgi:hypothetical protein
MNDTAILYPVFALALWTGLVLLLVPIVRIRAALQGRVAAEDFKFGESAAVPSDVSIPNRNYMNLFEIPVLFYVVCLLLFAIAGTSPVAVGLAWAYVGVRVIHSTIHLTYNNVIHRLTVFGISNAVLIALWVVAGHRLLSNV